MTIIVSASSVAATASDVPGKYDVIINSRGYRFLETVDGVFGKQQATYTYTPTFVPRTNVQGDYGDNQQDFWLTATQRDWSLGEQLKFFRQDDERARKFYQGTNIEVRTPGQVTLRRNTASLALSATVRACCPRGAAVNQNIIAAGTTNLYEIDTAGAETNRGAHGLGAAPSRFGACTDGTDIYLSTTAAGTTGVRKWDGASSVSYSSFSSSACDSLAFLNNTLYGLRNSTAELLRYDTSGGISSLFTWRQTDGGGRGGTPGRIMAFGAKLLIAWNDGPKGPELYIYDGTAPALIDTLPSNFYIHDVVDLNGGLFIAGSYVQISGGTTTDFVVRPAIRFWVSGQPGELWRADNYISTAVTDLTTAGHPAVTTFDDGLIFTDDTRGVIMFYNAATGGVHSIGSYTVAGSTPLATATQRSLILTRNQATAYLYPDTVSYTSSGTVLSSLFDFDSSLQKYFKSVKIDADVPSGASIDIDYQLEDVTGSYTSLVASAATATEYTIGSNGRAISMRLTLNRGTSDSGPTLKRLYVRAAPVRDTFKMREYVLDLSGRRGEQMLQLRDGTTHARSGQQMAEDLVTAATVTSPIAFTDRFSTYNGVIDPDGFKLVQVRPEEYSAVVPVREV